ncbi:glycosyltransferase family 32 protein [[Candida] arabinofermentans NRRL YB-2248]|uniref:Glycosyltransferase family 32 protein n=1 Tax=[Candida] arabinofermentans NRRL YB-2248 TaxID=983967 RepID=A0A1E4SUK3_9ASCO|nr:glycosyltransferase family 32 protein [[Candida] arabinofermentans NRRL YB-2248]
MNRSFSQFFNSPSLAAVPASSYKPRSRLLNAVVSIWRPYQYLVSSALLIILILQVHYSLGFGSSSSITLQQVTSLYPNAFGGNHTSGFIITPPPSMNVRDMYTIESRLHHFFPYDSKADIENNIWQLWVYRSDDKRFPSKCFPHIERWRIVNDNYNHNLISTSEAEILVKDYFSSEVPEVAEALAKMPDNRLKFEFLKYLVIYISGGLYSDIDTICTKPLKYWHESQLIPTRLFLGISIDYNDENWKLLYNRRLLISNKLFRAKSHHPFLAKLIARITYMTLNQLSVIESIDWNRAFQNLDSNGEPLIQFTGESIFTDTLFEYLNSLEDPVIYRVARSDRDILPQKIVGPEVPRSEKINYRLFTQTVGPTQVDDVVVMPEVTFRGSSELEMHDDPSNMLNNDGTKKNGLEVEYDDENQRKGYARFYYARPLNLLTWDDKK